MSDGQMLLVLVLEDSPHDVFLLRAALSKIAPSAQLVHFERLSDALEWLQKSAVDLVLTDLNLPDSGGVDTIRPLVAHAAKAPVVVLVGYNSPEIGPQVIQAGAWGHICKDRLNSPVLAQSVAEAMQRKSARPQA